MSLKEDISAAVSSVVGAAWDIRDGNVVPETSDVSLANGGVRLEAVYLYADMADSTTLARDFSRETAAKVIRAYLDATCRVVRARGGEIRSFDGDRVMAVFIGDTKRTDAAKCALQVKWVVDKIVRPKAEAKLASLKEAGYVIRHCTGIALGKALIVRGGVRGRNDLVSVGRAPNLAAKLSEVRNFPSRTYITKNVYDGMMKTAKVSSDGRAMWTAATRTVGGEKMTVYKSGWGWVL